jgi:hypothetical protein
MSTEFHTTYSRDGVLVPYGTNTLAPKEIKSLVAAAPDLLAALERTRYSMPVEAMKAR